MIETNYKRLLHAYQSELGVKDQISKYNHVINFNDAWDDLDGRFEYLRRFCGGLAVAFANTNSLESDFLY